MVQQYLNVLSLIVWIILKGRRYCFSLTRESVVNSILCSINVVHPGFVVNVQELFAIIFLNCLCCTLIKSSLILMSSIPQPSEIDCDSTKLSEISCFPSELSPITATEHTYISDVC